MKVGIQYLGGPVSPKVFARQAESAGFDSVWCGDHVAHYVDGISALGCFAGCTDAITIGTNVLVAPFRPAVVTAKAVATIARIAEGRFIAGLGIGGDFPEELYAVGADPRNRGAATDELLELLPLLLAGDPVTFEGRWTSLDGFAMTPAPEQRPAVWIGGRADAALKRVIARGDGYLGYLLSVGGLATRAERLRALASEAGRQAPTLACNVICVPAASESEALDQFAASDIELSGMGPDVARQVTLLGDEDACVARAAEYAALGLDHLILGCLPGDEHYLKEFIAATTALLPALHALG